MGFAVVFLVVFVGYVLGRRNSLGAGGRQALASLVYLVATPALLFDRLIVTDPAEIFSANFVVIVASALLAGFLFFLLCRTLLQRNTADSLIGMLAASYANAGNLGIPLAVYVIDDAAAVVPVILFQVAFYAPITLTILDAVNSSQQSNLLRNLIQAPLTNPMVIAAIIGMFFAFLEIPVPQLISEPVGILAGASVPLALLVFGMSLAGAPVLREGARDAILASLFKVVLMPIIAGLMAHYIFGMQGHALLTAVVLAALPTAQNVNAYALRFRTAENLARDAGLVSTLACVPVLVLISFLLG
ncbi:putative transporter YfdV [Corynebacterium occultum]|uniref:Putative transporter YfdV n=2 Tax=Corynebacterium occultum TaxID=2675219 RepID=A0A6B8VQX4_9CORY|nr:putative transporter YfdV [Corynebacterium occultum]